MINLRQLKVTQKQFAAMQVRKIDTVEVANYLMERMGKDSATAELIHPDELVSGIISQVAAEPDMGQLLAGLVYSQDGQLILAYSTLVHSSFISLLL